MTTTPVCACSRPIKDSAFICLTCTETLERQLGDIGALSADLDVTRTRQSRTGGASIGIVVRGERPIPWNERAAKVALRLHATLTTWVRLCQDWRVRPEGPTCRTCQHPTCALLRSLAEPADDDASLSRYLLAALPALRHRPEVQECADDLTALAAAVEEVTDRKAELVFYGPCNSVDYIDGEPDPACTPCPEDLYGPADSLELTCRICAAPHDVTLVRERMVEVAQDRLVTASDLSRFLTIYGEPLTAERIRKWAERGQLAAHGHDQRGRPLYRVSEAVEQLTKATERKTA